MVIPLGSTMLLKNNATPYKMVKATILVFGNCKHEFLISTIKSKTFFSIDKIQIEKLKSFTFFFFPFARFELPSLNFLLRFEFKISSIVIPVFLADIGKISPFLTRMLCFLGLILFLQLFVDQPPPSVL